MAEEEKVDEQIPDEGQGPAKKGNSKNLIMLSAIGLVVFVLAIAGFSFMMGVFSTPETADEGTDSDKTAQVASDNEHGAKESKKSEDDDYQAEIARLEAELFGVDEVSDAEDMDDIMELADEEEEADSGMTEEDSVTAAKWLETEKAKLAQERKVIDERLEELEKQEYRLKQLIAKKNQMQSARVASLARLYDGMKADQVAPLIIKLDEEQAVDILLKMKPGNAAKILGTINADRAARISTRMITLTEEN